MISSISRCLLKCFGWQIIKATQQTKRCVLIVYPHTSNWDFVIGILVKSAEKLHVQWLGKKELFWGPAGFFMRALGGIPVDRKQPDGMLDTLAQRFSTEQQLTIAITPEGTRSFRPHWKSGFYRLAKAADVPIVMVALDFTSKQIRFSEPLYLAEDTATDLTKIQHFYTGVTGKFHALAAPIELPSLDTKNPSS